MSNWSAGSAVAAQQRKLGRNMMLELASRGCCPAHLHFTVVCETWSEPYMETASVRTGVDEELAFVPSVLTDKY